MSCPGACRHTCRPESHVGATGEQGRVDRRSSHGSAHRRRYSPDHPTGHRIAAPPPSWLMSLFFRKIGGFRNMNSRIRYTLAGITSMVLGAAAFAAQPAAAFAATTPAPSPLPGLSCSVNQGLLPGIPNLGPTGPDGPLGPQGPLGGSGNLPCGLSVLNLGPTGPLGPQGALGAGAQPTA